MKSLRKVFSGGGIDFNKTMKDVVVNMQEDRGAIAEVGTKVDADYETNFVINSLFKKDKKEDGNRVAKDLYTDTFFDKVKGKDDKVDQGVLGKYVDQAKGNRQISRERLNQAEEDTAVVEAFSFLMQEKLQAYNEQNEKLEALNKKKNSTDSKGEIEKIEQEKAKTEQDAAKVLKDSVKKEHEIKKRRMAQDVLEKRLKSDGRIPSFGRGLRLLSRELY